MDTKMAFLLLIFVLSTGSVNASYAVNQGVNENNLITNNDFNLSIPNEKLDINIVKYGIWGSYALPWAYIETTIRKKNQSDQRRYKIKFSVTAWDAHRGNDIQTQIGWIQSQENETSLKICTPNWIILNCNVDQIPISR